MSLLPQKSLTLAVDMVMADTEEETRETGAAASYALETTAILVDYCK